MNLGAQVDVLTCLPPAVTHGKESLGALSAVIEKAKLFSQTSMRKNADILAYVI